MRVADMARMSAEGENGEKYRNKIVEMLGGLYVPYCSVHSGMRGGRGARTHTPTCDADDHAHTRSMHIIFHILYHMRTDDMALFRRTEVGICVPVFPAPICIYVYIYIYPRSLPGRAQTGQMQNPIDDIDFTGASPHTPTLTLLPRTLLPRTFPASDTVQGTSLKDISQPERVER